VQLASGNIGQAEANLQTRAAARQRLARARRMHDRCAQIEGAKRVQSEPLADVERVARAQLDGNCQFR